MQDDKEIFDLQVREMLQSAEVKAPRSARGAVLKRLAPAAPVRSAWRWAAPSFAFAAASLLAFVAVFGLERQEEEVIREAEALVCVVTPSTPDPTAVAQNLAVPKSAVRKSGSSRGVAPGAGTTPESATAEAGSEEPRAAKTQPEARSAEDKQKEIAKASDYWKVDEKQPERKSGSMALTANGNVGSQDSRFAPSVIRPSFSSGYTSDGIQELTESSYGIPVSLGLGVRYNISDRWSVGAGLSWTMLSRSFEGKYKTSEGSFSHISHYIGVPVSIYYNILSTSKTRFYAHAGASAEKCISDRYYLRSESAAPILSQKVRGLQYGAGAGVGVEFRLSNLLGLYVDPGVHYYFGNGQPTSIRTDKPLIFSFEAGLKFNL